MQKSILTIENISVEELTEIIRKVVREELNQTSVISDRPKYYTREETAEMLHITLPTLNDYTRHGFIKGHRLGRRILYDLADIKKAITEIPTLKYSRR